jgi:hypothetical protein
MTRRRAILDPPAGIKITRKPRGIGVSGDTSVPLPRVLVERGGTHGGADAQIAQIGVGICAAAGAVRGTGLCRSITLMV